MIEKIIVQEKLQVVVREPTCMNDSFCTAVFKLTYSTYDGVNVFMLLLCNISTELILCGVTTILFLHYKFLVENMHLQFICCL